MQIEEQNEYLFIEKLGLKVATLQGVTQQKNTINKQLGNSVEDCVKYQADINTNVYNERFIIKQLVHYF